MLLYVAAGITFGRPGDCGGPMGLQVPQEQKGGSCRDSEGEVTVEKGHRSKGERSHRVPNHIQTQS